MGFFLIDFGERGRERWRMREKEEREKKGLRERQRQTDRDREKNTDQLPPVHTTIKLATWAYGQIRNPTCHLLVHWSTLNQFDHNSQG